MLTNPLNLRWKWNLSAKQPPPGRPPPLPRVLSVKAGPLHVSPWEMWSGCTSLSPGPVLGSEVWEPSRDYLAVHSLWASLVTWSEKNLPAMQICVWVLGGEDPLEKEMATCSSILTWKIPWTEKPGGLQSKGYRVRCDLETINYKNSIRRHKKRTKHQPGFWI